MVTHWHVCVCVYYSYIIHTYSLRKSPITAKNDVRSICEGIAMYAKAYIRTYVNIGCALEVPFAMPRLERYGNQHHLRTVYRGILII